MQANLGVALSTRFEALGQVADLDAAIEAYGKALAVAREGSPDWAKWQANLGVALRTRFEALGQVADLDAAIAKPSARRWRWPARAPPTGPNGRPTWGAREGCPPHAL
jgi:hypothetical protein